MHASESPVRAKAWILLGWSAWQSKPLPWSRDASPPSSLPQRSQEPLSMPERMAPHTSEARLSRRRRASQSKARARRGRAGRFAPRRPPCHALLPRRGKRAVPPSSALREGDSGGGPISRVPVRCPPDVSASGPGLVRPGGASTFGRASQRSPTHPAPRPSSLGEEGGSFPSPSRLAGGGFRGRVAGTVAPRKDRRARSSEA